MIRGIRNRLNTFKQRRETANELNRLSDRELSDIGIHRSEIQDIVNRTI